MGQGTTEQSNDWITQYFMAVFPRNDCAVNTLVCNMLILLDNEMKATNAEIATLDSATLVYTLVTGNLLPVFEFVMIEQLQKVNMHNVTGGLTKMAFLFQTFHPKPMNPEQIEDLYTLKWAH